MPELGNIVMNDKTKVLAEVIARNEEPPVTLINDTVQYNAGSFKVQPNASVEQLLKKIAGSKSGKRWNCKSAGRKSAESIGRWKRIFWQ